MDSWPQEQQRHKVRASVTFCRSAQLTILQRTFDEMSQHASLSPSPFFFGHPMPSGPLDNPPSFFERRRMSHPHNQASQSSYHPQDNMPEPRALQRPSLEHRTSQTIIDLTDDAGEPNMGGVNARFMSRPPQLGRSDAQVLGDIIDLTEGDDELEIIDTRRVTEPQQAPQPYTRNRQLPYPRQRLRPGRDDSPSMFVPEHLPDPRSMYRDSGEPAPRDILRNNPIGRLVGLAGHVGNLANLIPQWGSDDRFSFFVVGNGNQRMPDHLDYGAHAFARPRQQPKPQHQPPPPAKPGFTRSPKEDDVAICPGCMNELVAEKGNEEPVAVKKPNGKVPNKKDREEHHFWVVKECGHVSLRPTRKTRLTSQVYCNKCYKGRKPDKRDTSNFNKGTSATGKTIPICAVDGCNQDVGDKKHWIGVFI